MSLLKKLTPAALLLVAGSAFGTSENNLDFLNESMTFNSIGSGTNSGFFIWASNSYTQLNVAWSDDDSDGRDTYFTNLIVASGADSFAEVSIEGNGSGDFVSAPVIFGSVAVNIQERTANGVDGFTLTFDPEILIGQDLDFHLASTDSGVDDCADFGLSTNCIGDFTTGKAISIWDAALADWVTPNVEIQPLYNNDVAQKFELTRVPEPASLALLGLGLAGLGAARRRQK